MKTAAILEFKGRGRFDTCMETIVSLIKHHMGSNESKKQHTLCSNAGAWPKCMRKTTYIVLARRHMARMYAENNIHLLERTLVAKCMWKTVYIVLKRW